MSPIAPDTIIGQKYKIIRRIGSGSFGEIYSGSLISQDDPTQLQQVAIKLEKKSARCPQLRHEFKVYRELQGCTGIGRVMYFGSYRDCNVMVMELLGPSLEDLFNQCGRRFSLKTTLQIADQLLERAETLHENHLIHRDIKPANFVANLDDTSAQLVFCIDFGLSKRYRHPHTLQHIPYREGRSLTGTPRYASIANHQGIETSRRDDLESIGYILVYFLLGKLPWQGLKLPPNVSATASQKHRLILDKKQLTPLHDLCKGCPPEFEEFLQYCRELQFDAKPNMRFVRNLFRELYRRQGFHQTGTEWDWQKKTEFIERPRSAAACKKPPPAAAASASSNGNNNNYAVAATRTSSKYASSASKVLEDQAKDEESGARGGTSAKPSSTRGLLVQTTNSRRGSGGGPTPSDAASGGRSGRYAAGSSGASSGGAAATAAAAAPPEKVTVTIPSARPSTAASEMANVGSFAAARPWTAQTQGDRSVHVDAQQPRQRTATAKPSSSSSQGKFLTGSSRALSGRSAGGGGGDQGLGATEPPSPQQQQAPRTAYDRGHGASSHATAATASRVRPSTAPGRGESANNAAAPQNTTTTTNNNSNNNNNNNNNSINNINNNNTAAAPTQASKPFWQTAADDGRARSANSAWSDANPRRNKLVQKDHHRYVMDEGYGSRGGGASSGRAADPNGQYGSGGQSHLVAGSLSLVRHRRASQQNKYRNSYNSGSLWQQQQQHAQQARESSSSSRTPGWNNAAAAAAAAGARSSSSSSKMPSRPASAAATRTQKIVAPPGGYRSSRHTRF